MDPNACLARFIRAIEAHDMAEAADAAADLRDWIEAGGFEPRWLPDYDREWIMTYGEEV